MNYDTADLSDPLLKINVKNFGPPKGRRPMPPGNRKRRYDEIVPVRTAKKTFKQFTEQYTPKGTFTYPYDTRDGGLLDKIRTKDAKDYENAEFLRNTGIPIDLVKKKKIKKNIKTT